MVHSADVRSERRAPIERPGSRCAGSDVGAWASPFNRAQWILDAEPFETRGYYRTFGGRPFQGGDREWFSKDTWVQRDICAREPWPFTDKQFDFVICSHTLEDIRDPLWVCSELIRVGKAGYIEVPSRVAESTLGVERPNIAGFSCDGAPAMHGDLQPRYRFAAGDVSGGCD